jgi:hypothetical protein
MVFAVKPDKKTVLPETVPPVVDKKDSEEYDSQ